MGYTITTTTSLLNGTAIGANSSFQKVADSFETVGAGSMEAVKVGLRKQGSPTDNVIVSIQADAAGVPSGTDLASGSIVASSLTGSGVQYEIALNVPVALAASTKYWVVLSRSGSLDGTNTARSCCDQSYPPDHQIKWNGSAWAGTGAAGSEGGIMHIVVDVITEVFAISGIVSLNGTPVEGAIVRCIRQSDNVVETEQTTDASGVYAFAYLDVAELYHVAVEYEDVNGKYNALSLWDVVPVEVV